ncbi:unnamed protein product [Meganyctiphanes norvegica]|uniref:Uncharacterized protein n=1 Tax=Meganyctiphanes norvegica TaxID=48144 RepID=A0AAV2Q030_MEGNR
MSPYNKNESDSFNSRVLSLPAVKETVTAIEDVYNKTKASSEIVGKTLELAELSMRRASAAGLPLMKPIIDTMGGAEAIDQWMCDGLQKAEQAAPIITKPADEIVTETRRYVRNSTAGLPEAMVELTNNTMQAMTKNPIGKVTVDITTQVTNLSLDIAHAMIDTVYSNYKNNKVNNPDDVVEKATALVDKLQGMTEALIGSTPATTQQQKGTNSNKKNVSIFNKYD